jgi:hypothetical protein
MCIRTGSKQTFAAWPTNGSSEVQATQAFLGFICAQTSRGLLSHVKWDNIGTVHNVAVDYTPQEPRTIRYAQVPGYPALVA